MSIIFDIILLILLLISFIIGYKKGFLKSIWKIAALVVTIIVVAALKSPAEEAFMNTPAADTLRSRIAENITLPPGGGVNIAETLNLPEFIQKQVNEQMETADDTVTSLEDAAVNTLTSLSATVIVCVGLFIAVRLLLMLVYIIAGAAAKLPLVRGVNRLAGGLLSLVNAVFIIFIVLAAMSLLTPSNSELFELIDNSYIVKYFYHYNILLQLFMK